MKDALATELMSVIVLAMACPDPRIGMNLLGHGVAVALSADRTPPAETPLLPLSDEPQDGPLGWDFADPRFAAAMRPDYEHTAEYHYAMAAHERAMRDGG